MTGKADGFDYQSEADKTCSIEWRPWQVNREDFLRNLRVFVETASVINIYKKLLFRGKTCSELNMRLPFDGESLEGFIPPRSIDLVHGIVGTATEAGELAEILIDLIEHGKADRINAVEEGGDILWYLNRVFRWAEVSFDEAERVNIAKLHGRGFAQGFNPLADSNRDLANERAILEGHGGDLQERGYITREHPSLPLGVYGDEEAGEVTYGERDGPCAGCEGMDC